MARNPKKSSRYSSIEEAEELLRRGYFADPETYRISKQIVRDFDIVNDTNEIEIKLETAPKKKWWKFWK